MSFYQRVEPPSQRYGVPRDNACHLGIREKDGSARESRELTQMIFS